MSAPLQRLTHQLARLISLGTTSAWPETLNKRIRLTNGMSLFAALIMLASIPFDWVEAPRWMIAEDVVGALAYLCLPLLNRLGRLTLSRLLCIALSDFIVLGNAALLGRESGASMVFIAITALPFALFDLRDRLSVALGVTLSIACFAVAESGVLSHLRQVTGNYQSFHYQFYSGVVTFAGLLFSLVQTALANERAEDALRRDIDERLRAERELERTRQTSIYSAKMAALGEMSSNIAHEVNNPLSAILLRAQRLLRLVAKDPIDVEAIKKTAMDIETTVDRIRRIIDALRSFARDGDSDPLKPESVRQIVRDTVELCAQRFDQHAIDLRVDPIPEDLFVDCRATQISQILLNLLGNAHDAVENQPRRAVRVTTEEEAGQVIIAVTDSGPGIPPDLESRIMAPFFTTKAVGKGTGLGLSVSRGIAEAHHGRLEYDAGAPDTRFVLTLKKGAPPAGAGRPPMVPFPVSPSTATATATATAPSPPTVSPPAAAAPSPPTGRDPQG